MQPYKVVRCSKNAPALQFMTESIRRIRDINK
jgi:hypothetical protein